MLRLAFIVTLIGATQAAAAVANDYPTTARVDYVVGCMASNGHNQEMLERCSCSIDTIAGLVPYKRYIQAETILRMGQVGGEKSVVFKTSAHFKAIVEDLKRAQIEAELQCF
ncbi:MAG: hypothetical protein AAF495_07610 [Pseudomonadota bacterium]